VLRGAERRIERTLPRDTAAVVSTYPLASQALGTLRRDGRLSVPALTYLTDFSTHPLWVAAGIDQHLAAHQVPARQARACGATSVAVTGPLVGSGFAPATGAERGEARVRFGLPPDAPLALLVAGSWGVGDVERAAREIRDTGVALPVVVCGRNDVLCRRLRAAGIEYAFGWVGDMPALLRAVDVLVQNAGGLTCLEAFATGVPVASYRSIPGHGMTNCAALDEAGLALWIKRRAELANGLRELMTGARGEAQRAAGLALFERVSGPAELVKDLVARHRAVCQDTAISASQNAAASMDPEPALADGGTPGTRTRGTRVTAIIPSPRDMLGGNPLGLTTRRARRGNGRARGALDATTATPDSTATRVVTIER
jgi:UDP-N-acetylglucosamine:LPS N-acetylglucosamine transferase